MALTQLTAEQMARLRPWWGNQDPYGPQYVSEEVWTEYSDEEWPLEEFIATLQKAMSKAAKAERATARIALEFGYDGGGSLKLSYTREKTDQEKQVEIDRAIEWLNENDARERAEFARLSAKFKA